MKGYSNQLYNGKRSMVFCFLCLNVVLLFMSSPGLLAAQRETPARRQIEIQVEEGKSGVQNLKINNDCLKPRHFRIKNKIKYLRIELADDILIEPNSSKLIEMVFNATRLKSKVYRDQVVVICLDCKNKPECKIRDRNRVFIKMTVTKPAPIRESPSEQRNLILGNELKRVVRGVREKIQADERHLESKEVPENIVGESFPVGQKLKIARSFISSASVAFDAQKVVRIVDSSRDLLLEQLPQTEFAGLRAYLKQFYPRISPTDILKVPSSPKPIISLRTKERVFQGMYDIISRLEFVSNHLSVNLDVKSDPTQAAVEIWPEVGDRRATTTESTFQNLYRGLYNYRVTKAGFKTIERTINLVDEDGRSFKCKLYGLEDKDGPYPCSLK